MTHPINNSHTNRTTRPFTTTDVKPSQPLGHQFVPVLQKDFLLLARIVVYPLDLFLYMFSHNYGGKVQSH
jgi:hypothetical protein